MYMLAVFFPVAIYTARRVALLPILILDVQFVNV